MELLASRPGVDARALRQLALRRDREALLEQLQALGFAKLGQRLRIEQALLREPDQPAAPQPLAGSSGESLALTAEPGYLPLSLDYPGLRKLHSAPPVFTCDSFLPPAECDELVRLAQPLLGRSQTQGGESHGRTSSTCHLVATPGCAPHALLARVARLTRQPPERLEMVQVTRYAEGQQYVEHYDGEPNSGTGARAAFFSNGGQRVATVLVYLNDVPRGGSTAFPRLAHGRGLRVQPRKGRALIFFPGTTDGELDTDALHAGLPAVDTKFVSQVWVRQGRYDAEGQASSPLAQALLSALPPRGSRTS